MSSCKQLFVCLHVEWCDSKYRFSEYTQIIVSKRG